MLSVIVVAHFSRYSGVIERKIIRKKKLGSVNIVLPRSPQIRTAAALTLLVLLCN